MMKWKKWLAAVLSAVMLTGLTACGGNVPADQTPEETGTPAVDEQEEQPSTEQEEQPSTETDFADASGYTGNVDNANIDAAVYLDYSAGLAAGVYRWIPSDDGDYYTLAVSWRGRHRVMDVKRQHLLQPAFIIPPAFVCESRAIASSISICTLLPLHSCV